MDIKHYLKMTLLCSGMQSEEFSISEPSRSTTWSTHSTERPRGTAHSTNFFEYPRTQVKLSGRSTSSDFLMCRASWHRSFGFHEKLHSEEITRGRNDSRHVPHSFCCTISFNATPRIAAKPQATRFSWENSLSFDGECLAIIVSA